MIRIDPSETILAGQWALRAGRLAADEMCERISALTGSYLLEFGKDASGWDTLYRAPADGRLWKLIYPESEFRGGGPPQIVDPTKSAPIANDHVILDGN
jgi:hypothetical protein